MAVLAIYQVSIGPVPDPPRGGGVYVVSRVFLSGKAAATSVNVPMITSALSDLLLR